MLWPRTFNHGCFREGTHLPAQLQPEAGKSIQKSMKKTSWASMSKNPATPVTLPLSSHSCTDFLSLHAAWTACAAQEASSSLAAKNGIWLDHWGVLSKETYRKPTGNHDFSHERCKLCKFSHQVWKGWLRQPKNMKVMGGHRPTWNQQRIIGAPLRGMLGLNLSGLSCSRFTSTIDTRVSYGFKMGGFRMSWI